MIENTRRGRYRPNLVNASRTDIWLRLTLQGDYRTPRRRSMAIGSPVLMNSPSALYTLVDGQDVDKPERWAYRGLVWRKEAMQVLIPDDAEAFVRNQAVIAGYQEVSEYLMSLVRQDHEMRKYLEPFTADERVEKLAIEGIESGPPAPLDMDAIRREVRERAEE